MLEIQRRALFRQLSGEIRLLMVIYFIYQSSALKALKSIFYIIFKGTSSSKNCCKDYNEKAVTCLIESGTIHNAWTAGGNEKGSH